MGIEVESGSAASRRRAAAARAPPPARPPRAPGGGLTRAAQEEPHMTKHGKRYQELAKLVDRDAGLPARGGGRAAQGDLHGQVRRRPSRRTSASASTPATRTRWSAARSCSRTAPARPSGSRCSPRATRPRRRCRAGADEVGGEDLVKKIEAGWLEFDVALATPDMMGKVGRLGRILGRRGPHAEPQVGHDHVRPRARRSARSRAAASSSRSTRAASSTSRRQGQLRARPARRRTSPR